MVVLVFFTFSATVIAIPLDVLRFHWLPEAAAMVRYFGLLLFLTGWLIMTVALKENRFAAPVVKHQADRHQTVVDQGLYRIVRHPMYAGAVLFLIGMPLWLGSYVAVLVATLAIAVLAVRAVFEERFLQRELQGYAAYTNRVRYRIVPFIW
jgi:protein-S-isoprenylcysteine O-methyltransferase Ste14